MDNELIYIKPDITFYVSFDEAFSDDSEYARYLPFDQKKWEFTDFFRFPKTFVIAEPGYGKTELLHQIVSNALKEGKNAIAVEIKKINQTSVQAFIVNQAKREDVHKSENFELKNEKNVIICLDALDEVKPQKFLQTVEQIKTFFYHSTIILVDLINSANLKRCDDFVEDSVPLILSQKDKFCASFVGRQSNLVCLAQHFDDLQ